MADGEAPVLIRPAWPAHPRVRAASTTRRGGVSRGAFHSFNLGTRAGDDPAHVAENRRRLSAALQLPSAPHWLHQVHGTRVVRLSDELPPDCEADAAWTDTSGRVCVAMSADCLPVLLADREGRCVAAAHAGWRGLAAGVIEAAVGSLPVPAAGLIAWLGPAIGPQAFEVGAEVRARFVAAADTAGAAFTANAQGRYLCDLYSLARQRLVQAGVAADAVFGGGRCTHTEESVFFSYRRDGECGRMASLIWLEA